MKFIRDLLVICAGIISLLYLLNVTFGVAEILPDNLPLVGNLDEAGATAILISCLAYFGIDVTRILKRRDSPPPPARPRDIDI